MKNEEKTFLSTPSARRATANGNTIYDGVEVFLSTPSARRATKAAQAHQAEHKISIHALREEGDVLCSSATRGTAHFYPRPPRGGRRKEAKFMAALYDFYPRPPRGGRRSQTSAASTTVYFYPRPPRGGRLGELLNSAGRHVISIHALREEGDNGAYLDNLLEDVFLSTPSARRATD